jgi:hypothetical protein
MRKGVLYRGGEFPELVFTDQVVSYLFVEFEFVFSEDFWEVFKRFLNDNNIGSLIVENIEPAFSFIGNIDVKSLPESFMSLTRAKTIEGYFPTKESLYIVTEETLIYSPENEGLFCIFLDRKVDLGILGFSTPQNAGVVDGFAIKDIVDYLTICFGGKSVPDTFRAKLVKNWKIGK